MNVKKTTTVNGEKAYGSTGSEHVDLFYKIGSARNNQETIEGVFEKAITSNSLIASSILAWARDARKGAGERKTFRTLFKKVVDNDESLAKKLLDIVPDIGRYDDLRVAFGTNLEKHTLKLWAKGIKDKNELAFKWVNIKKDHNLRKFLKLSKKDFRKLIVSGRPNITETKMCSKDWGNIDYKKVPSVCMNKFNKAFKRNDGTRFEKWLESNQKINASVLYPYQIYKTSQNNTVLANKQWDSLTLDVSKNVLPIVDVSGSMSCQAASNVSCMEVAISLGVYIAQKNQGVFKNKLITFSESSEIYTLPQTKDVSQLFSFTRRMDWGMSTNLEAAYDNILKEAIKANAKQKNMPEYLLILSDMQFNRCANMDHTAFQSMRVKFKKHGYKLPIIIFWNLNAAYGNVPTTKKTKNVCMVSGFSPAILESVTNADLKKITPESIMLNTIEPYLDGLM